MIHVFFKQKIHYSKSHGNLHLRKIFSSLSVFLEISRFFVLSLFGKLFLLFNRKMFHLGFLLVILLFLGHGISPADGYTCDEFLLEKQGLRMCCKSKTVDKYLGIDL